MSEKMRKFLDTVVEKAAGTNDQVWFTSSTEHRDRQGDVIVSDGWKTKDYMKNPVFLWAHDYSKPPIGKTVELEKGNGKLRQKVEFVPAHIDPFAEQVKQLYLNGFLNTVSVGFMAYKAEPLTEEDLKQRPEMKYGARLSGDLLELSAVPVPANPMALQNGFMEAVAKGMERTGQEPRNGEALPDLLALMDGPQESQLRRVRAMAAIMLGARGGLGMPKAEAVKEFNLLREAAAELGDKSMDSIVFDLGVTQDGAYLREAFADVWDDEVLDLLAKAKELGPLFPTPAPAASEIGTDDAEAIKAALSATAKTMEAVKALLK